MSRTATACAAEPLDLLVWRATGQGAAAVARVLDVNQGLAAIGTALPEHTPVLVPALAATASDTALVQLWD